MIERVLIVWQETVLPGSRSAQIRLLITRVNTHNLTIIDLLSGEDAVLALHIHHVAFQGLYLHGCPLLASGDVAPPVRESLELS